MAQAIDRFQQVSVHNPSLRSGFSTWAFGFAGVMLSSFVELLLGPMFPCFDQQDVVWSSKFPAFSGSALVILVRIVWLSWGFLFPSLFLLAQILTISNVKWKRSSLWTIHFLLGVLFSLGVLAPKNTEFGFVKYIPLLLMSISIGASIQTYMDNEKNLDIRPGASRVKMNQSQWMFVGSILYGLSSLIWLNRIISSASLFAFFWVVKYRLETAPIVEQIQESVEMVQDKLSRAASPIAEAASRIAHGKAKNT